MDPGVHWHVAGDGLPLLAPGSTGPERARWGRSGKTEDINSELPFSLFRRRRGDHRHTIDNQLNTFCNLRYVPEHRKKHC